MKKSKIRRVIKYIVWTVVSLIVFLLLSAGVIIYLVFTPERITPIVMKYANDYMNAHLDCESVELTFYSTFPNFGIRLRNGSVIIPNDSVFACPKDTLLKFDDCSVSFNPLVLYKENRLIINYARLEHPVVYLYVNPEGKNNWDILPQGDSIDDSTAQLPEIKVKRIRITDADIVYDDRKQSLFIATDSMQLRARGEPTDVYLSLEVQALTTLYEDKSYTSKLPFTLATHLSSDKSYQRFDIEKSTLSIGFVDFDLDGTVQRDTADSNAGVDLEFKLHASSFADLMNAIPEHVLNMDEFNFSGSLDFSGNIKGKLGANLYPACAVSFQLYDGAILDRQSKKPVIQKIEIDCNAGIDLMNNSPSYVNVKNIYLQNSFTQLNLSGVFQNILTKPFVDIKLNSKVDFDVLGQLFFVENEIAAGGSVAADIEGKFFIDDILNYNLGKVNITGAVDVDNVKFNYPDMGIDLFAPLAKIRFGSNVTDSIRGRSIASLLRANVNVDSLQLKWKDELSLRAGKLTADFRTSEPKDTATIAEMSAFARLNNLQLRTSDSVRIRATKIVAFTKSAPFDKNPSLPEWTMRISLDSIRGRMPDFAGRVDSAVLSLKLYPRETRRARQFTADDSLRRKNIIDSMIIANRNTSAIEFRLAEGATKQVLSNWDASGSFTSKNFRMMTPYFPLRTQLSELSATFTSDKLSIKHTRLQTETASMTLNGEIEGIRRALLYNGQINANIFTKIDSMDCNEIIRALATGSVYSSSTDEQQDSISNIILNDNVQIPTDSVSGLFVVPRNIDMELDASMKKVKYSSLNIAQADGKIIVRNRSIQIPKLKVESDIGNADFSMVYRAPTTKGAYTGLDIHMERVQLKELINSIPMLDTLTPMMRSFEGLVECNIIAVTELDSLSNLIIPKTTASCYINGKNMVLLDGETFSTIAKKLYFKNKKRNIIDSISVDLSLADGMISVFPFVLSIDRYIAAIGGTQNLDMSFQYHISILKWPVPLIKIGLNLWGNPDDIHYRIASRKYENLLTPVKEKSLQPIVVNLRQQLHDGIRKSIDDILNESSKTISRRRIPNVYNDTVQTLFKLDTTEIDLPIEN
ncbi:MAG: AsmA family protein [Prevotellaceae bacterium]|nr:AsmA family protein [Prevotellaceae bacterium]